MSGTATDSPPQWLAQTQLRWVWLAWEPLMMLRRHGGIFEAMQANAHWSEHWFHRIHSEEYIRTLADAGFNCVTTHFHKGFGPKAEADEMDMTRRLIDICHRHGIRVLAYVQSMSIMYETFLKEMPAAETWLQVDETGRPRTYAEQYWRLFPCLSHDDYVAFVETMVEKAIVWAGADGVWLDNTNFMACQCAACQRKFRTFLARRYPRPDPDRFGIDSLEAVRLPVVGRTYDPVYQEAMRFRCESLTAFAGRVRQQVRALNPEAAVAANFGAPCPYNAADVLGVDFGRCERAVDIVLAENGNFPTVEDGQVIHQAFGFKAGHAHGAVVVPSHWRLGPGDAVVTIMPDDVKQVALTLAECAAFGRRCIGATWAARADDLGRSTFLERPDVLPVVRRYNRFFAEHERHYLHARSLANVATYRNFASSAFAHEDFNSCVLGFEQSLLLGRVPFDVLFEDNLFERDRLRQYEVLVLANVLCLSDDEVERIRAFVLGGGGLIATGQTSLFDENLRQRRDFALADLFAAHERVMFLPQVPERVTFNHLNYQLRPALPTAHRELNGYVESLCAGGLPLRVCAEGLVAADITRADGEVNIHLVNYDNVCSVREVEVSIRVGAAMEHSVAHRTPDGADEVLEASRDEDRYVVRVPRIETYSLLVFSDRR